MLSLILSVVDWNEDIKINAPKLAPLVFVIGYPVSSVLAIACNKKNLDEQYIRDRIQNFYEEVHLTKNNWTIYFYPFYIIRRLLFAAIPVICQ
jgi:hypothetical protein